MKLAYYVTEQNYKEALRYQSRARLKTVRGVVDTFLLPFGQFIGLSVFCLVDGRHGVLPVLVMVLSLLFLLISLALHLPTTYRINALYRRVKQSGALTSDYDKQHRLALENDGLTLQYGKTQLRLPAVSVSEIAETPSCYLILTGSTIFCIIPRTAFRSEAEFSDFRKALRRAKFKSTVEMREQTQQELREKGMEPYCYNSNLDVFRSLQVAARRTAYSTPAGWKNGLWLKVLLSVGLLGAALFVPPFYIRLLLLLCLLLLNADTIRVFTPWMGKTVERQVRPFVSLGVDPSVELYADHQNLYVLGEVHCLVIPRSSVRQISPVSGGVGYYLDTRQMILTVPENGSGNQSVFQTKK